MRSQFDKQLEVLNIKLLEMASLVEKAISQTADSLMKQDALLAEKVIKEDSVINDKEREIETMCLTILLQQQPVACDFRLVTTALKIITDLERIGDQAVNIAELVQYLSKKQYIKKLIDIPKMAKISSKMVNNSIDAFIRKDVDLAESVIQEDDFVDALFANVKTDLIELIHQDVTKGEQAMDLLMIARFMERIGDHATNIAEWVIFSITGIHKSN